MVPRPGQWRRGVTSRDGEITASPPSDQLTDATRNREVDLLREMHQERDLSHWFISHDSDVVRYISYRVVVLCRGRFTETGSAAAVADEPLRGLPRQRFTGPRPGPAGRPSGGAPKSPGTTAVEVGGPPETGCPFAGRCHHVPSICGTRPRLVDIGRGQVACHMYDFD
ncbi:hypothetical protein GCM10020295_01230 [Streptomyces cinereospinus]